MVGEPVPGAQGSDGPSPSLTLSLLAAGTRSPQPFLV